MTAKDIAKRVMKLTDKSEAEAMGSLICFDGGADLTDITIANGNTTYAFNVTDEYPDYTDKEITKRLKAMNYL